MHVLISRGMAAILLANVLASSAEAQELAGSFDQLRVLVTKGETVTVTDSADRQVKGSILELSPSSLALMVDGTPRTFLEADVAAIRQRRPDSLANGAKWGLAVGASLGILAGLTLTSEYDAGAIGFMSALAAIYGGLGAGAGAGLDALHSGNQVIYARRRASSISLRPVLVPGRTGVVASFTFAVPRR